MRSGVVFPHRSPGHVRQASLDDLGQPLHDVRFCVLDLETTGGDPGSCAITEVGAALYRGGELLGTFQTLVNPGQAIPPRIVVLTGISEAMVVTAPAIDTVLPSLLEFIGDAVIVGHNIRFDTAFLNAALTQAGRPRLSHTTLDTLALARRLLVDEVPNCKLGTLATRLNLPNQPSHRALDDARATADLLHVLLERVGTMGITGLDDLLALPTIKGHPQLSKLGLTEQLPRTRGVYLFRDRHGRVLYVGKASNLRTRVRSYFSGDTRRKVGQLLRETDRVDHIECPAPLEADVLEMRLIHEHEPRFNRDGTRWRRYRYLKLTLDEPFPRFSIVRKPKPDRALYLGPIGSTRAARRVQEAIESVVPIRRCTGDPSRSTRTAPCVPAQLGVSLCPCTGEVDAEHYRAVIQRIVRGLTDDPSLLLEPLDRRMVELASSERFEEAADARDRAQALARAMARQRRFDAVRSAGTIRVELPGQGGAEVCNGRLVSAWTDDGQPRLGFDREEATPSPDQPIASDHVDELRCIVSWLDQRAHRLRLVHTDEPLQSPYPKLPDFVPTEAAG